MKSFFCFCVVIAAFNSAIAQSVSVSATSATKNNSASQFTISGTDLSISSSRPNFNQTAISSTVSNSGIVATLDADGLKKYEPNGSHIATIAYQTDASDKSYKIYAANNGATVVRENVANFIFYDEAGRILNSVSNSSQSREGESVSAFAADPAFKTMVVFNPQIIRNGVAGSRARLVHHSIGGIVDFYNSQEHAIRFVNVSPSGQFIAVITYNKNKDNQAHIFDRFGNEINSISFDQEIVGVDFSGDGRFLTVYSRGRAAAYNLINGSRVGSASFRTPLQFAKYFPADKTILALTANSDNAVLTNVEVHAINVDKRSIARQPVEGSLGMTELIEPVIERRGRFSYRISGLSQNLDVKASF